MTPKEGMDKLVIRHRVLEDSIKDLLKMHGFYTEIRNHRGEKVDEAKMQVLLAAKEIVVSLSNAGFSYQDYLNYHDPDHKQWGRDYLICPFYQVLKETFPPDIVH